MAREKRHGEVLVTAGAFIIATVAICLIVYGLVREIVGP
jgi:hypothetical protein